MESYWPRVTQVLQELQSNHPRSRFFLACKSCFQLKPPIIVEVGNSSECPWCGGRSNVLLFETKESRERGGLNDKESVEYAKIRERKSLSDVANSECKDNLGLRWKTCTRGDQCNFAHSRTELLVWKLESKHEIKWKDIVDFYNRGLPTTRDTLQGVFHCFACRKNTTTGKEFSAHCDLLSHKQMVESLGESTLTWNHRPLPEANLGSFALCYSVDSYRCSKGELCIYAHSKQELEEWKKRYRLQKEIKDKIANETGLLSFADQIYKEYEESSSRAEVMSTSVPNVMINANKNFQQTIPFNQRQVAWKVRIKSNESAIRLNHAAFLPLPGHANFTICRLRAGKRSKAATHINFTLLDEGCSYHLHGGGITFEIKFTVRQSYEAYGMSRGLLVFEFRNTSRKGLVTKIRPLLLVEFKVEYVDEAHEIVNRPSQPEAEVVWETERKKIPWEEDSQNEFDATLRNLLNKYKESVAALDFSGATQEVDPQSLVASNYVNEMHSFLYREEGARTRKLEGSKSYVIAMSKNYISSHGTLFNVPGELFAVFELRTNLSRDTDEGFLILDSCKKVLVGRKQFPQHPVYEAKIQEKFIDHIILLFSKKCVEDWNLKTGDVLDVEIKFQLDRERFCRCHSALDQLQQRKLLPLVCPDRKLVFESMRNNRNWYQDVANLGLDNDQRAVLRFLTRTQDSKPGSILPLFVMQGSFGTGKTYTISKCVTFLLRSDTTARILICTHSNSAADHYIHLSFEDVDEWKDHVVRVVYHARNPATVTKLVKKYCLTNENGQGFRYPTAQEIASHRVFITTFETALVLGQEGKTGISGAFTHIFLDEAAQAMEAETIIPLTVAHSANTKVVIAGDHKQIAQKIYSKENFKDSRFTLLERIFRIYFSSSQQYNHINSLSNLAFLRNNYRCVRPILELIASIFYVEDYFIPCTPSDASPPGLKPVQFFNVEGRCFQDPFSSEYYNIDEAYQIANTITDLLNSFPMHLSPKDIVVVSSYYQQVNVIRSHLKTKRLGNVEVIGVRGIQGLEYKVVILSCVHQRETKNDTEGANFGLLSDLNLLNTAFTRSMLSVIAVGHGPTLLSLGKCSAVWHKFLQTCSEQKGLFPSTTSLSSIKKAAIDISRLNPIAKKFIPVARKAQRQTYTEVKDDTLAEDMSQQNFSDNEDIENVTLPFDDDILNLIIKKDTGSSPENMVIKVDESGKENIDNDPSRSTFSRNKLQGKFYTSQLHELLKSNPNEYKRCVLKMVSWYSAEATVLDKDSDIQTILIKTRRALGKAFDGDEVVVHIRNQEDVVSNNKEVYGKVIGVLEECEDPLQKTFVCVVDKFSPGLMVPVSQKATKFVVWGSKRMNNEGIVSICKPNKDRTDFELCKEVTVNVNSISCDSVQHFIVRFLKWLPNETYPYGYVSEAIKPNDVEKYFSKVYDVPPPEHKRNPAVLKEAKKMSAENISTQKRLDLTNLFVFTIDPEGSKDLDDALSIRNCSTHNDCWEIGIHIADVASVVQKGTDVDLDAKDRATTFYRGDIKYIESVKQRKDNPMLPEVLSSDKCSLLPGKNRPAISMVLHSSHLPNILSPSKDFSESNIPTPFLTTIRSRRQMTYGEAEDKLRQSRKNGFNHFSVTTKENLPDQLHLIWQSMLKLRLSRIRGAAFTNRPEFDELREFYEETTAHMLIEEAMITYNACTAVFLDAKRCIFPLRTQESPIPNDSLLWLKENSQFIGLSLYQQFYKSKLSLNPNQVEEELFKNEPPSLLSVLPDVWEQIDLAIKRNDLESALVLFCSDAIQPAVSPGISGIQKIQRKAKMQVNTDVKRTLLDGAVSHFSLGLPLYSFCSSPIRRYSDIIIQRLVTLQCEEAVRPQKQTDVIELDHVGQYASQENLEAVSKQLQKRMDEAKRYEKDTQKVSFAKNLSNNQRYDMANVVEINKSDILLNFICLRNLPPSCYKLRFNELNLQEKEEMTLVWRIKYFDVKGEGERATGVSHRQLVSTTVSAQEWFRMISFIRDSYLDNSNAGVDRESAKQLFRSIHIQDNTRNRCTNRQGDSPCNNEKCKQCNDVYCYKSKLGIIHFRQISMTLSLGLPLCVQLYCTINRGICTASIQMLSLSQDLDICLAHLRSPIEIFAADVTSNKGKHFKDTLSYEKHWRPLFRMEAIYNAIKDGNSSRNTNFTLQNVEVKLDLQGAEGKKPGGSFLLDDKFCSKRLIGIALNDFLCLRIKNLSVEEANPPPGNCFTWIAHAVVSNVAPTRDESTTRYLFEFCASRTSRPRLSLLKEDTALVTVEVLKLGISDRFIAHALHEVDEESLPNWNEIESLCLDKNMPSDERDMEIFWKYGIEVGSDYIPGMNFRLNDGQIKQIKLALVRNISMIQGPPGTGKSYVGAHLAYYFREMNMKKDQNNKPGKILYCGPSNKSVDVVAEYLLNSRMKVLRVYGTTYEEHDYPNPLKPSLPPRKTKKRPDTKIADITLHHRIRREGNSFAARIKELDKKLPTLSGDELYEAYLKHKSLVNKAKREEVDKHDVIVCTCATAVLLTLQLEESQNKFHHAREGKKKKIPVKFTQCIIDECGMCSEPETIAPIVSSQAKQVVLIGDHMQLQPVIMCQRAKEFGLDVSMFERLKDHAGMLTNQYRMHSGICSFPSKQFYESSLTTDQSVMEREARRPFRFCYPATSYQNTAIFCQVDGVETVNYSSDRGGDNSVSNEMEAKAVVRILTYLHFTKQVKLSNIMILTPYTAQVRTITDRIQNERSKLMDVHVGTVVTSQGSESDYVILSTVRSQPKSAIEEDAPLHWRRKFIGFVADPHQINVAITRAKSGLCIVGNKNVLEKDTRTWKYLLESYQQSGSIVDLGSPDAPWNVV